MSFFETYGMPMPITKQPKPSKTAIKTIYESAVYQEFRDLRGENKTQLMRRDPTKKEISDWEWRQQNFEEVKEILTFLRANLTRAANRGDSNKKVEVDLDYVYSVGSSQDFQCALTGTDLEFTRGGQTWMGKWCNPNSCTIDRIDSSKGYVEGNIQLVTWKANCLKQHLDDDEFIEFCKEVAFWRK